MNIEERKKQIQLLINKYYYENDFLKGKSLDKFLNKAYEKFLYSNLTISDIEKEIIKAIERKKNMIQGVSSNRNQNATQNPINNSNTIDKATISHSGGYANSFAITTTTLIAFISIMIIYVLLCIIF